MSLEAWGDEGDILPDGYVSEESYLEQEEALQGATVLLWRAFCRLHGYSADRRDPLCNDIEKWMDNNIPKERIGEPWQQAVNRLLLERKATKGEKDVHVQSKAG